MLLLFPYLQPMNILLYFIDSDKVILFGVNIVSNLELTQVLILLI